MRHDALTIAEALRAAGYGTYMAGKWDLGQREDQVPVARGFDRSFAMLPGTSSHYDEPLPEQRQPVYWEDDHHVADVPDDFYSTQFYTDKLIGFIEEGNAEQPFFAYLAYSAPHFPLQAPVKYIDRYIGVSDAGYDAVRNARLERMTATGVIPEGFASNPLPGDAIAWENWPSDEERKLEVRRMQV